MKMSRVFSPEDLRRIEEAVRDAEKRTSGEIVPYVVERSDGYADATWRGATLGALVAALGSAAAFHAVEVWGMPLALWIAAPAVLGAGLGLLASELAPPFKRLLVPRGVLAERVRERAAQAFLSEEVFATRERTGMLIFLSLFERRVVVTGDRGIAAKVRQEEWDGIVGGIVRGMREGKPGDALAAAIRECGDLLARHGVDVRPDDRDELANGLRLGKP
jgi:putative membrane protein